jgi:hypothetical protein
MKAASLVARMIDDSMVALPADGLDALLLTAKEARNTGLLNGVPVLEGVVMANWKNAVVYDFRVDPKVRDAVAELGGKKRKGK